jgi:GT2 family glycosyltransferase
MIPVVIPTYRAGERLQRTIDSVRAQNIATDIFIRDNSEDNIYYTAAVNEGLRKFCYSSFDYVLVLSDDVILHDGCIDALVSAMKEDEHCGIVAPLQFDGGGKPTWTGSLGSWPQGIHGLEDTRGRKPYNTFWSSGACFLLRTKCVRDCGLLDPNLRFICSDSDYSFTIRARGWNVTVAPDAVVTHSFNGSADLENEELMRVKIEDVVYFTSKWITGDLFRSLEFGGLNISHDRAANLIKDFALYLKEKR